MLLSANRTSGRNDEKMYSVPPAREACFDQGDVKVEKDIVTFNEEKGEDILEDEPHCCFRREVAKRFSGSRLDNEPFYRS